MEKKSEQEINKGRLIRERMCVREDVRERERIGEDVCV